MPSRRAWRSDESGALTRVRMPFPDAPDIDVSRPMASEHSADYFYDVRDQTGRFLVAVEPDGHGFGQTSTAALTGRKLFLWGAGSGGSRWQEWLSGPDARYCEIQAGACPTQLEHDRLIGHGVASWTESFGAIDLAPDVVAGDYERATTLAAAAVHDAAARGTAREPPPALVARTWRTRPRTRSSPKAAVGGTPNCCSAARNRGHTDPPSRSPGSPTRAPPP